MDDLDTAVCPSIKSPLSGWVKANSPWLRIFLLAFKAEHLTVLCPNVDWTQGRESNLLFYLLAMRNSSAGPQARASV